MFGAAQLLDIRRAEKDPEKTGNKCCPGGDERPERCGEKRRQVTRMIPTAEEPNELQDHDERTGRRFGKPESIEHLIGTEPLIVFDRQLRDIGEDCIRPAEGHKRSFTEK